MRRNKSASRAINANAARLQMQTMVANQFGRGHLMAAASRSKDLAGREKRGRNSGPGLGNNNITVKVNLIWPKRGGAESEEQWGSGRQFFRCVL